MKDFQVGEKVIVKEESNWHWQFCPLVIGEIAEITEIQKNGQIRLQFNVLQSKKISQGMVGRINCTEWLYNIKNIEHIPTIKKTKKIQKQ